MRSLRPLPLAVAALALLTGAACNESDATVFTSQLSGANEVPPRSTAASGAAGITIDGQTINFSIEVSNISNVTAAHIHTGSASVTGPVRVTLFAGPTTSVTGTGILASGSVPSSAVTGITFDQLVSEMRAGNAYVNVHTTQFPAGEIRGQTRLVQ